MFPKLSAFQEIDGRLLRGVRHIEDQGNLARVVLDFGAVVLIVDAVAHDDSIDFKSEKVTDPGATSTNITTQSDFWQEFIDQSFGWGWVTINQQGYCDGLLLSFGGIDAQVLMNVIASSIKLRRIST